MEKLNGIWVGKESSIIITDEVQVVFFRIKQDLICSLFKSLKTKTFSLVYGKGINWDASSDAIIFKNNQEILQTKEEMIELMHKHLKDKIIYDRDKKILPYILFDNTIYENTLLEKIDDSLFNKKDEIDNSFSLIEKMKNWNIFQQINLKDNSISVNIHTAKYAICYNIFFENEIFIYCRFVQHGYCNKGWAMLSTTCLRKNEVRMIDDHRDVVKDYIPNESYFVQDSVLFLMMVVGIGRLKKLLIILYHFKVVVVRYIRYLEKFKILILYYILYFFNSY